MDASDAVGLARVATCSRALQNLFSDGAVKASMTHCREASDRASLLEAQLQGVVALCDAAEEERDELALELEDAEAAREAAEDAQALAEDHRDAAEQARDDAEEERDRARVRIRELELELADAKRARR